ncbi:hypothetical protein K469DRAFT_750482 [Zopfia rhizophila CBS 207.26]|uniref:Carbohydrate-binding module family 13 protein n=1 Tax=Zopfia rhizophila CBS 207.26 TaxID=1314779 RepID=A0A6A6E0P7_9PEZI|nr:hypothetical protein K469DRAFT_750482 [Zopfia rhizophila CBS 207.26]
MDHPPNESLPEVVPDQSPEALSNHEAHLHPTQLEEQYPKYPVNLDDAREPRSAADNLHAMERRRTYEKEEELMICGLRRKAFWLLIALVLVIVPVSVGGGVGGGIAAAKTREGNGSGNSGVFSSSSNTTPVLTTSSPTTGALSTTSASPSLTFLNNQTVPSPGHAFQGFTGTNYTGNATAVIRDEGFLDLPFNCSSYVWLPNGTDCCVTFCNNMTYSGGWWCDERRQPNASGPFPRIWVGCGEDAHKRHTCS